MRPVYIGRISFWGNLSFLIQVVGWKKNDVCIT